jgi:hypothetical protein
VSENRLGQTSAIADRQDRSFDRGANSPRPGAQSFNQYGMSLRAAAAGAVLRETSTAAVAVTACWLRGPLRGRICAGAGLSRSFTSGAGGRTSDTRTSCITGLVLTGAGDVSRGCSGNRANLRSMLSAMRRGMGGAARATARAEASGATNHAATATKPQAIATAAIV